MTDKPYGTLYIGITSDLGRRAFEHKNGLVKGFTKRYGLKTLVYAETHATALDAIAREKAMKEWKRDWKIQLMAKANPKWRDLSEEII